ncbi:MAG TPA: GAF domain-containing sensor histidine kinase [Chloroflexia bacterium]|nr:GAF domain-containing sensor histidine kinase [Chloroflexia bacterium]
MALKAISQKLGPDFKSMVITTGTRIPARWLFPARLVWLISVALEIITYLASIPNYYRVTTTLCDGPNCLQGELDLASLQALTAIGVSPESYALFTLVVRTGPVVLLWLLAGVLFWRKSDDILVLMIGLMLVTYNNFSVGPVELLFYTRSWLSYPAAYIMALAFVAVTIVFGLFPGERFVPGWLGWLVLPGDALVVLLIGLELALDPSNRDWLEVILGLVTMLVLVLLLGGQVYRFFKISDRVQHQQVKWVSYSLLIMMAVDFLVGTLNTAVPALAALQNNYLYNSLVDTFRLTLSLVLPVALIVAITRYRLWDIDLLINRTLVFTILSAGVIGFYALFVSGFELLFQTSGFSFLVSLLATGLITLLFQPIRLRVQRAINRLTYGEQDDPYLVLSQLGQRLEGAAEPKTLLLTIVQTISATFRTPYVSLSLKQGEMLETVAEYGQANGQAFKLPLLYQGEKIGELSFAPRSPGEIYSPRDWRLLEDLARQAGVASHSLRLTGDLQRSREKLVVAREEELRRIRRDLHDGLGPALASLTFKIDAVRNLLQREPQTAEKLLVELKQQTRATVADIRRLVYALRPPALDELGLIGAVQEQAERLQQSGLVVLVKPEGDFSNLPAAVEVAVYRVIQEALTNVVKHARARHCWVWVVKEFAIERSQSQVEEARVTDAFNLGWLRLEIRDDGLGLPADSTAGVGLSSMRERVEELGGSWQIESKGEKGGVEIVAKIPLLVGRSYSEGERKGQV